MRRVKVLALILGFAVAPSILVSAEVKYTASVPVTLEDFENPETWTVEFSPLRCDKWEGAEWAQANGRPVAITAAGTANEGTQPTQSGDAPQDWIRWLSVDNVPSERRLTFLPLVMQKDQSDKMIMGIKSCWKNPGYNWVSVSPKQPLYTPAYPVSFAMYVWGNNYKYDIYVIVKNSEGTYHNLFLGSMAYAGWRELRVNFPAYVFPVNRHNDNSRLEIVKIRILTKPNEESVGFYTYFDNIVIQQAFEQSALYDGASLSDEKW